MSLEFFFSFFFWIFHINIIMDMVKASQGHTLNLSKYWFSQYPSHQSLWIFFIIHFFKLLHSVLLVLFCPLSSNSVYLDLLRSTLVLFRPILIRSILSTLVLFGPFCPLCSYSILSFQSFHIGFIRSNSVHTVLFGPL